MKKLILVAALAAATLSGAGIASAQYYPAPPPGYYDEPPQPYYRPRYIERDYDEPRYYRRDRDYDRGNFRTFNGCPPRYTVQDGECKPYRGY